MPQLRVVPTAAAGPRELQRLRRLLDEAFDGDFPDDDWEHALGGWHVLLSDDGTPVAHAAVVPRSIEFGGRRLSSGYVEAVASAPGRRREGLGGLVMAETAGVLRRNFDVGVLSTGIPRFYARLGWERWRGPSFVRRGDTLERTEDEDDGIMVLRFGRSRDLDLAGRIVCDARAGDDW